MYYEIGVYWWIVDGVSIVEIVCKHDVGLDQIVVICLIVYGDQLLSVFGDCVVIGWWFWDDDWWYYGCDLVVIRLWSDK